MSFSTHAPERLYLWEEQLAFKLRKLSPIPAWKLFCFSVLGSTMDVAREHAESKGVCPALVLSEHQLAGRGRRGRSWQEAKCGFYGTYVFTVPLEAESRVHAAPLAAGVVLNDVFLSLGCKTFLKWPNDLLSEDGRKLSGILLELLKGRLEIYLLIGIGVNLSGEPETDCAAVSVESLSGTKISPLDFAALVSFSLFDAITSLSEHGFGNFREKWLACAFGMGREIKVESSGRVLEGAFAGVNSSGHLVLETARERLELPSAEVLHFTDSLIE